MLETRRTRRRFKRWVSNGFERLLHASLPETSLTGMAISVNHLMGVGEGRGTPVGAVIDADEDAEDDGDCDGVVVSFGGSDGTSEALKCKTADRTSRNLKRAFSGCVESAFSQRPKMQLCLLETFGDPIGAAHTAPKRRAKRVRKKTDNTGERIIKRGGVRREQATKKSERVV